MEILIEGKRAVVAAGTKIEYVAENRDFTDSDGFSLNIDFPLRDCPENLEIFGWLCRLEFLPEKIKFDAQIIDGDLVLNGAIAVVGMDERNLKGQFLQGKSAENFYDGFDEIRLIDLDLGRYPTSSASSVTPADVTDYYGDCYEKYGAVALPWVNENSEGIMNNQYKISEGEILGYQWTDESLYSGLTWQPWLIFVAKRVCEQIGYEYDFEAWENSDFKYLLMCNTLPPTYGLSNYADAMPDWSVKDFFENLEPLLNCEFDIDRTYKKVTMRFVEDVLEAIKPVRIDEVVDEFSASVDVEESDDSKYRGEVQYAFKERSDDDWKYLCCDKAFKEILKRWESEDGFYDRWGSLKLYRFDTFEDFSREYCQKWRDFNSNDRGGTIVEVRNALIYIEETKTYYAMKYISMVWIGTEVTKLPYRNFTVHTKVYNYRTEPVPLNIFGYDEEKKVENIDITPVWINEAERGNKVMFLNPQGMDQIKSTREDDAINDNGVVHQMPKSLAGNFIATYQDKEKKAYYDSLIVGFYGGMFTTQEGLYRHPAYDRAQVIFTGAFWKEIFRGDAGIRLNSSVKDKYYKINERIKYEISFLSDTIPNPRAVFYIRGRKFLCEKIKLTLGENGRSKLMEGEFYPVIED